MGRFLKASLAALLMTAAAAAGSRGLIAQGAKVPDLSGDWASDRTRGGFGQSLSIADMGGRNRGNEPDIPYQPWARTKTMSEKPSTGANSQFDVTTDPQVIYCEPPGVPHIYLWPVKTKFVQTAEAVYILLRARPVLPCRVVERKAPGGSRSAMVGALDRPLRERRHAGRGHDRVQ